MSKTVEYNTGNMKKYKTGNPLKRYLVRKFDALLLEMLQQLHEEGQMCSPVRVLDAGCGEGFFASQIKERFSEWNVVGLDGAEEAIRIAKRTVPDIEFHVGNIYEMPFEDKVFDIVVCSEVLEHLEYPEKAVEELKRVANKGLLLSVPHEPFFRLGNFFALHNISTLGNPIDHINHWSYQGFQDFTEARLSEFSCSYAKSFPWSICVGHRR